MRSVTGRLDKLEKTLAPARWPQLGIRVLVSGMCKPASLTTSSCTRTLREGVLTEIVDLDGSCDGLSDEELENFIESFPIREEAAAFDSIEWNWHST
jgi:hypothetical protein